MTDVLPTTTHGQVVRTVSLDGIDEALLALLPATGGHAWVRDGAGFVGWGTAARFTTSGTERFSRVQRWWNAWCAQASVDDHVGVPGTGPVAFASFTFDAGPQESVVLVPSVLVGHRAGRTWLTTVGPEPGTAAAAADQDSVAPQGVLRWSPGSRPVEHWARAVAEAIGRISAGELDKVVLARDLVAELPGPLAEADLLRRLAEAYPECWTFSVDGLLGATPELLVRRAGDRVTSRVLAGTVRRRGDESVDADLAEALLASGKDLEEHDYAVHSVAESLAAHCTDLDVPAAPHVLTLANVQHLATDVSGLLADRAPALALAASLHPTAAVCGTPTERAAALIRELEGMDRGRYAGPVGWIDAHGDGEFGIALRCGALEDSPRGPGTRLRLFAGCGIVAGSSAEAEIAESEAKLDAVRKALTQ
ncbi:MAG TPA: isochorismate synthase [Candidatus Nanopelagicales bacterium]